MVYLSKRIWEESTSDIKYLYCYLSIMAVAIAPLLTSIYFLLWVTSFVDSGYLQSESEAKLIYSRIVNSALVVMVLLMPFIGVMADKIAPNILLPTCFFIRGLSQYVFIYFLEVPDSVWIVVNGCLMITMCMLLVVSTIAVFLRTIPQDIRGTMQGCFQFFA